MGTRRALLVWVGLPGIPFANGAVRELVFVPRLGNAPAHALSVAILSLAIVIVSLGAIAWIHPRSLAEAWKVGLLWLALTLAFELLAGHYVFGTPCSRLLA